MNTFNSVEILKEKKVCGFLATHGCDNFLLRISHTERDNIITEIEELREDYGEACKVIRHMEDRVREWRSEGTTYREALEKIQECAFDFAKGKTRIGSDFELLYSIATEALRKENG